MEAAFAAAMAVRPERFYRLSRTTSILGTDTSSQAPSIAGVRFFERADFPLIS
jgi:hypothetical protein